MYICVRFPLQSNMSFVSKNIKIANLFLTFTSEEDLIWYSLIKCLNAAADDERSPSNASAAAAADDPRPSDEPRLHHERAEQDVRHDGLGH